MQDFKMYFGSSLSLFQINIQIKYLLGSHFWHLIKLALTRFGSFSNLINIPFTCSC